MVNKTETIHVIHEREGPALIRGFTKDEDARNYFNHEVAAGKLSDRYYTISPMTLEDMVPVVIPDDPGLALKSLRLQVFVADAARDNAIEWVNRNLDSSVDEGTRKIAIIMVTQKIEEIVNDPASGTYGFRKAQLYLQHCKFDHSRLVYTEPAPQGLIIEHP